MVRLEEVRQEQARAIMALEAIPESGASDAMIPLGGGVQIIADIPSEAGAVVDIGGGIQAEDTRGSIGDFIHKKSRITTSNGQSKIRI